MKSSFFSLKILTRTALLLALTLVLQGFRFPAFITGPLVNFMLIISTIIVGTGSGVIIGLITPWIALLAGILPGPLAPAIPFIMIGNGVFCLLFGLLHRDNWRYSVLGVSVGALAKFLIIAGAAQFVLSLPGPITQVLLFPQLVNALIGGFIALGVGRYLKKIL